jgi:hypothetical protein
MSSMIILIVGVFGALGIVFAYDALREEAIDDAIETTADRAVGVLTGAVSALGAGLAVGIEQLPELLIGLLGVGSLLADIPWQMFLVGALLLWMISETITMRREAA